MSTCSLDYQGHRRRGEEACPECKAAHAETMRAYRKANPGVLTDQQRNRKAREAALADLARLYPQQYRTLLRDRQAEQRDERLEQRRAS